MGRRTSPSSARPTIGDTPNLVIEGNWLDGGHCTVKLQSLKTYRLNVRLHSNRFGPHRRVRYCPVQAGRPGPGDRLEQPATRNRRPIVIYRG